MLYSANSGYFKQCKCKTKQPMVCREVQQAVWPCTALEESCSATFEMERNVLLSATVDAKWEVADTMRAVDVSTGGSAAIGECRGDCPFSKIRALRWRHVTPLLAPAPLLSCGGCLHRGVDKHAVLCASCRSCVEAEQTSGDLTLIAHRCRSSNEHGLIAGA